MNISDISNNKHDEVLNEVGLRKFVKDNGLYYESVSVQKSVRVTDFNTQYIKVFEFGLGSDDYNVYHFSIIYYIQRESPASVTQIIINLAHFNISGGMALIYCPQSLDGYNILFRRNPEDLTYIEVFFRCPHNNSEPRIHGFIINPSVQILVDNSDTVYNGVPNSTPYSITVTM